MSHQTELWKPVTERYPEVTSKAMPKLLKQAEKIGKDQLKEKISVMGEVRIVSRDNPETIINQLAMLGNLIVIVAIMTAI